MGSSAVKPANFSSLDGTDFPFLTRDLAGGGFDVSKVSSDLKKSIGCEGISVGAVYSGGGCAAVGGLDRLNRGNTFLGLADRHEFTRSHSSERAFTTHSHLVVSFRQPL